MPRSIRIVQVVDSVLAKSSGLSKSVVNLSLRLRGARQEVVLLARDGSSVEQFGGHGDYTVVFEPGPSRSLGLSLKLRQRLREESTRSDIVHSHGLWRMAGSYAASAAHLNRKPHIVSTHGMLSPEALKISRNAKRLFWHFRQRHCLHSAACLHATSEQEYVDIRAAGLRVPVAIIPYGVDVSPDGSSKNRTRAREILFVGRIHPIKNLEALIAAWSRVQDRHVDAVLRIVGSGEPSYVAGLRSLARLSGARITFEGPMFGLDKVEVYRRAQALVLPSLSENFGLVVAEALSEATPVISTSSAPWSGLDLHKCGFCVQNSVDALAGALDAVMSSTPAEIEAMGNRGRQWMIEEFSWDRVADQMGELYRFLLAEAPPPPTVRFL